MTKPAPKNKDALALAAVFVLCAFNFTEPLITLLVGLMTWVVFQIAFRRNIKVLAALISCLFSFAAFEYFGGMIIRSQIARTYETDANHRLRPNQFAGINSDGVRCPVESSDFQTSTCNITFLGDSFTYGEGLKDIRDTFPAQVEEILNARRPPRRVRTVNFGWTSSSPLLSYRLLSEIGAKYKPALVVLCLDMTDFHDDLRYHLGTDMIGAPPIQVIIHRLGLGEYYMQLRSRWVIGDLWQRFASSRAVIPDHRFFITQQPLGDSLPFMNETEQNIRDIARFTRDDLHASFLLVMLPRSYQYSTRECPKNWEAENYQAGGPFVLEPFKWLKAVQARVDFPCCSILEDFQNTKVFPTCFEDDPHWTRDGNRVAAEGIVRCIEAGGFIK